MLELCQCPNIYGPDCKCCGDSVLTTNTTLKLRYYGKNMINGLLHNPFPTTGEFQTNISQ